MKVILNVDAITHPITGIGQYTLALGQQLQHHDGIENIRFFSNDRWVPEITQAATQNRWLARMRQVVPFKTQALNLYANRRARKFQQLTQGHGQNQSNHVFHSPNFILMPFKGRSVATFHDLSFVHYRDTQPKYRLQFLDREISKTLQQSDAIITPTEYVKQEIITTYDYPAAQIHVTPLGVSEQFKPYIEVQCADTLTPLKLSYKSYILSVATTEPRKNLQRLLEAYTLLPKDLRKYYPLVLVGSDGWLNHDLKQQIKKLINQQQIISLGFVTTQQLQHLYAAAALTAMPSIYEGFGLPIIESMASGTAVLTSRNSAMQEVAGGHAMLCEPLDVLSVSTGMSNALEDKPWRKKAEKDGLVHSESFTWARCADMTVKAYTN